MSEFPVQGLWGRYLPSCLVAAWVAMAGGGMLVLPGCWPPAAFWAGYVVYAIVLDQDGELLKHIAVEISVVDENGRAMKNHFGPSDNYTYYDDTPGQFEIWVATEAYFSYLGPARGVHMPATPKQVLMTVDWDGGHQQFTVEVSEEMVTTPWPAEYHIDLGTLVVSSDALPAVKRVGGPGSLNLGD